MRASTPEAALKLDAPHDAVFRLAEGRIARIGGEPADALVFGAR